MPGQTMNKFTIRMQPTTLSSYSTYAWQGSGWTTVYQSNQTISSTGWTNVNFTTPFNYDGVSNLMVDFSFNNPSSPAATATPTRPPPPRPVSFTTTRTTATATR